MAEVAGLVLGVAGLAGLIGAFKDVVDLYSLFIDSKHLGRDYEVLDTKLDIEKTLLLRWADRVGLLRTDHDPRLDAPDTRDTIFPVLACIRSLLSDASQLKTRYGVQTFSLQDSELASPEPMTIDATENTCRMISNRAMERLVREFGNMRLRMQIPQQTRLKRFRWAIRDKQQFESLLRDLSHFTTKLDSLIPAAVPTSLTSNDLQCIQDLRGLKIVLEASLGLGRSAIAEAAQQSIDKKRQEKVLDMLWFRTMTAREEEIKPAHSETMDWALEPPRHGDNWDDLSEWFRSGEGIYWVSGKAGSGKSTLMKRLVRHSRTENLLREWARGGPHNIASFFFCYHGTPEQQSQEGLSRSLLHQILLRHPSIIRDALPGMWKELERNQDEQVSLPSRTEIKQAFRTVTSMFTELGRFCLFIDGVDEFNGDHRDAITFIKELTVNLGVKAVVSSRPIPECVAGFQDCPRLRLQDLTRRDIAKYVDGIIGGHPYMQKLLNRHPDQARRLKDEIMHKSSGVFLWVVLACRSLRSGFADCDQVADLQRRVEELPPELEEMFKLMLSKINKRHRQEGALVMRLRFELHSPRFTDVSRLLMDEGLKTFGLALLMRSGDGQHADIHRQLSAVEKRELCEEFRGWLRSRCGGLLELQPRHASACDEDDYDPVVNSCIGWMHRSVFEFLQDEKVWEFESLQLDKSKPGVSTALSLYGLYLGIQTPINEDVHAWCRLLALSCLMGARADVEDPAGCENSFWKMGPALQRLHLNSGEDLDTDADPSLLSIIKTLLDTRHENSEGVSHATLLLAAEFGAVNYLKAHLESLQQALRNELEVSCDHPRMLEYSVCRPLLSSMGHGLYRNLSLPSKSVISLLLSSGADPKLTRPPNKGTTRFYWLDYVVSGAWRRSCGEHDVVDITVMFLAAGADPDSAMVGSWIPRFLSNETNWGELTVPRNDLLRAIEILQQRGRHVISHPSSGTSSAASNAQPTKTEDGNRAGDGHGTETDRHSEENHVYAGALMPTQELNPVRARKRGRPISLDEEGVGGRGKRINTQPLD